MMSDSENSFCNSLAKAMEITAAVIQYISIVAQSFGNQDQYSESLMMILGLAGVLFGENEKT